MKTFGTIIRLHPLTESSLIVHWITDEYGLIKTVAKGARRPKSPFSGKLDLFFRAEIEIRASAKSDLHTLCELVLHSPRLGLRKSYTQTLAASYFVKLISKVAEPEAPMPEVADLLERGLNYLEENPANEKAMIHFEKQLSEFLGILETSRAPHLTIQDQFGPLPSQRQELVEKFR